MQAGAVQLAGVGIALSVYSTVTKLFNVPLLSVATSSVATAYGEHGGQKLCMLPCTACHNALSLDDCEQFMFCISILTVQFTRQVMSTCHKQYHKSCPRCLQYAIQLNDTLGCICDNNSAQITAGSHKEVSEAASAVLLLAVIVGLCEVSC